ncbi:hypothetical protein FHW88_002159 [Mucilaginibacter sp. SG538B]|uniref:hypothetical protein n=1 Tax=Mucilaginibacter TaxID=423349 RepID=UPI0008714AFE|nr:MULTISPECIES: hypothetical protein [unclassified Mucilaginibacter]NVM63870.1 hypothetical protein [Mucilaginibacter sp. SG538B]SCW69798.1 hypothetical protein SAMN03159284_03155 [Mucilaginibacter sp. NFR10]
MKLHTVILSFLLFAVIIAVPPFLLSKSTHAAWLDPHFWMIYAFVTGLTFITIVSILMVTKINKEIYAQTFLGATMIKLLTCMFFCLFFLVKIKVNGVIFVANFFYVYFFNLAFEIYGLLRTLRNQKLK